MEQIKIYLELSDELQEVLNDNGISIEDILEQEGIEADVTYGVMPTQAEEGARSKDVVTIILVSSALVLAISVAISNVLSTLYRKPIHVVEDDVIVLQDAKGKVLKDKEGNPLVERVKRHKLLEPRAADREQNLGIKWKELVMGFSSSEKQLNTPDRSEEKLESDTDGELYKLSGKDLEL